MQVVYNHRIMIDKIDRKIVHKLIENGRCSYTQLAKELGTSLATVSKRVDTLLQDNVISIQAVINPDKLGYRAGATLTLNIELSKMKEICDQLAAFPNVSLMVTLLGRFDILLFIDNRNWEELQDFIKTKLSRIPGIKKVDTYLILEVIKRNKGLFAANASNQTIEIDAIDRQLIEELRKDARVNHSILAETLGVSSSTISRRIYRLTQEHIISITAIVDPTKWGLLANAYVFLKTDLNKVDEICSILFKYPQIHQIVKFMNTVEIMFILTLENAKVLHDFITENISTIDGVLNIEAFLRIDLKKRSYAWIDRDLALQVVK